MRTTQQKYDFNRTLMERNRLARRTQRNIESLGRDPMCVPQLTFDIGREEGQTYAQSLRAYIEFVLTDGQVNPLDTLVIY
jgi:hypothetical protein